jgi:hypothetical protein
VLGLVVLVPAPGPSWPADVAPVAAYVARDRGLVFTRPVPVHLLAPRVFDRTVAASDRPTDGAQRADDRRQAAELRALGLLGGRVDLVQSQTGLDTGDVDGYYDPGARDVVLRGTTLTPGVRVTLAHELTHVLQDQHFGLNRLDDLSATDGQALAIEGLEEGDAVAEEDDYLATLSPAAQRQAEGASGSAPGPAPAPTEDASVLDVESNTPYVLGPDLVDALYAVGGNAGIDAAYRRPPRAELDLLDPADYLARVPLTAVRPPPRPDGARADGAPDDLGALTLYLLMAGRLGARPALAAAEHWRGGTEVQFRAAGRSCLVADLAGDGPAGTAALAAALAAWAAALPPGQAEVTRVGPLVRLQACDPGPTARTGPRSLEAALDLADQRDATITDALVDGAPPLVARCVGDAALSRPGLLAAEHRVDQAVGSAPAGASATVNRGVAALVRACRLTGS